jgi:hypothetical protein
MSLNKPDHSMISDLPASVTTDKTNADNISSGVLGVAQGGTGKSVFRNLDILTCGATGSMDAYQLTAGANANIYKSGNNLVLASTASGTGGFNGAMGATGATGPRGATGATGSRGATGPTGDTGPTGATGTSGATGSTGVRGPVGATGPAGTNGASGATGLAGIAGATGAVGATGATGIGAAGATGKIGKYSVPVREIFSGDGNAKTFNFEVADAYGASTAANSVVFVDGAWQDGESSSPAYTIASNSITFLSAPGPYSPIIVYRFGQGGTVAI